MRTLKFTDEEIDLLQRALGIAEMAFSETRREYLSKLVNVRGVSLEEARKETDLMFQKENEFCDLLLAIKALEKDV